MGDFYAGLDLGQASDYTALAIIERVDVQQGETRLEHEEIEHKPTPDGLCVPSAFPPLVEIRQKVVTNTVVQYHLRHLERPAIGTPYTEAVKRVVSLMGTPELRRAPLVIDRTGVGRAVYDMFTNADLYAGTVGVTITAGDTVAYEGGSYRVPKRDLVGVLQVLLQQQRLKVAEGLALGPVFAAEALTFKAKISERGHDSYEAGSAADWREGAHDDLVLAVTLACWYAERPQPRILFFDF